MLSIVMISGISTSHQSGFFATDKLRFTELSNSVSLKITQFPILVPTKNFGNKSGKSNLKSTFASSVIV